MTNDPVKLQRTIQYSFQNPEFLKEAITHRSFATENNISYDNQRLEFLGDAVLQIILTEYLFLRYPEFQEGDLTKLRSALANQETLAELAKDISLGDALLLGHGEIENGGKLRESTLSDAMEALLAAIMLDSCMDNAKKIFLTLLAKRYPEPSDLLRNLNPKGALQEYTQQKCGTQPEYKLISVSGPDHSPIFEVELRLQGKRITGATANKRKTAETLAAQSALKLIENGLLTLQNSIQEKKKEEVIV